MVETSRHVIIQSFIKGGKNMRIIVGVTGASGVEMSYYLVKALKNIE